MSIHSRRSTQTVLDCLEKHADAGIPVLHWFSGNFSDLNRAIDRGYWFSVGPAMLHGTKGRALAERMPRDRILTESDGPFVQLHGHSILPWEVSQAVDALGRLWSIASEETQKALRDNLRRLLELI
jgi:TatD DNase family protein